jgi:dTDP-4-amino-4,6-dideoxygalactose transaminase
MMNKNQKIKLKHTINYSEQFIDKADVMSVKNILTSKSISQGPATAIFEKKLKNYFGSKYASCVSSGAAALHLIGKALKWKNGDKIITTPNTFVATANAICYAGADPLFVDIDQKTYNLDLNKLEKKIKKTNKYKKKIKAIIAVDYAGNPCDWPDLRYIGNKHNLTLINDNCHALGSKINNDSQYAIKYADIVSQSFQTLKNITTGEGGAVITNNFDIYKKINILRTHGLIKNSKVSKFWDSEMAELGFNYRLTDFQSALGTSQLKKINTFIKKRRKIARVYDVFFSSFEHFVIPQVKKNFFHAYHLYPLQVDFNSAKIKKKKLLNYFLKNKFRLQVHYKPIHLYKFYQKKYSYKFGDFPVAEKFYENEISLPVHVNLKKNEQDYFLYLFKKFLKI